MCTECELLFDPGTDGKLVVGRTRTGTYVALMQQAVLDAGRSRRAHARTRE